MTMILITINCRINSQLLHAMYPELILRGISQLVPGLSRYIGKLTSSTCSVDAGFYSRTRENLPLVGPAPSGIRGSFVACAFSGYGIMAAHAAGELVAQHVVGDMLPAFHKELLPTRYNDPNYMAAMELRLRNPSVVGGSL
jgi:glycine/D-amino acid oxidase-like deaminating enzyme